MTVDFNLVATEDGEFVEVQGRGKKRPLLNRTRRIGRAGAPGGCGSDCSAARGLGAINGFGAGIVM